MTPGGPRGLLALPLARRCPPLLIEAGLWAMAALAEPFASMGTEI